MFEALFSQRGLSLDRLKVLIEVRDAGSIAQAVPGDPVRQSQYSRQLRELSEYFGCEVAQRRGKVLVLTSQGERLAELAREQLRALEDFRAECQEQSVAFTLGAGDSLIQWLVIPRLGKIVDAFPGTHFATTNLRTNEIVRQLTESRIAGDREGPRRAADARAFVPVISPDDGRAAQRTLLVDRARNRGRRGGRQPDSSSREPAAARTRPRGHAGVEPAADSGASQRCADREQTAARAAIVAFGRRNATRADVRRVLRRRVRPRDCATGSPASRDNRTRCTR